ncbi:MAG TPA: hypothetical protein VKF15_08350 [Nitrososphaerales archaeon]|nr:hypothetical protein [Nitrososphaerales archaeon]
MVKGIDLAPSRDEKRGGMAVFSAALSTALPVHAMAASALQAGPAGDISLVLFFFVFLAIVVAASIARSRSGKRTVQRPLSEATSFPPPPPPDTVMVKCEYCGTEQTWRENCVQCGAPMPKPKIG